MDTRLRAQADILRLDSEGNWFQGDYPILHDRTCKYLHKNITRDDDGNFFLSGEEKPIPIQVEDVPYWVTRVERTIAGYLIHLTDESIELLDPVNVWVGKKESLYCRVKGGMLAAKFQRIPYNEVTKDLSEKGGKFYLAIGSKTYPISREPLMDLTPKKVSVKSARKAASRSSLQSAKAAPSAKPTKKPIQKAAKAIQKKPVKKTAAKSKKVKKK